MSNDTCHQEKKLFKFNHYKIETIIISFVIVHFNPMYLEWFWDMLSAIVN